MNLSNTEAAKHQPGDDQPGDRGVREAGAAFAGAAVNRPLESWVVLIGFAALMVAAGIRMLGEQVPMGGTAPCPAAESTGAAACPTPSAPGSRSGSSPVCSAAAS